MCFPVNFAKFSKTPFYTEYARETASYVIFLWNLTTFNTCLDRLQKN